jgi:hypothetical protein
MASPFERRRFSRYQIPLAVEFCTQVPDTGELLQGQGWLCDISLGGAYLQLNLPWGLQLGQILRLTIITPLPYLYGPGLSRLEAKGGVVRLNPPAPDRPQLGVAVQFLDSLAFAPAPELNGPSCSEN